VVGQVGILCSLCLCARHKEISFLDLLNSNLAAGNFYTFSISLIAAATVPFLMEYLEKKGNVKFKHYKLLTSLLIVALLMVPMTALYTVMITDSAKGQISTSNVTLDWLQIGFYFVTMVACTYAFCLVHLDRDYQSYADLDNEEVVRLRKSVPKSGGQDSRNIQI
jgi:hypothetical protein